MKEKEKARELMCKFNFKQNAESGDLIFYQTPEESQRCALIAVDETVNMFISIHSKLVEIDMLNGDVKETATYQYWQEVKKEIESYDTKGL